MIKDWIEFLSSNTLASWLVLIVVVGIALASWQLWKDFDILTATKSASEALRDLAERLRK